MQICQLQRFVVVATSRTMTEAAARLNISQQGLSASIARLERELDVELLEHGRHSVCLTPAGRRFAHAAQPVLAAAELMVQGCRVANPGDQAAARAASR